MANNINCSACSELRESAPELEVFGFSDEMCASLQNNTGLNPSDDNDSCTDLNNMNDCLIGNMAEELPSYEVCDWKKFMKTFIGNLWTTLKGIISSICGLWTNLKRLDCIIEYITSEHEFDFGEKYASADTSHIVAGKGVSFLNVSASGTAGDIGIHFVAGGLARTVGSCLFYSNNFTEQASCYNFDDNGDGTHKSSNRVGNPYWYGRNTKPGDSEDKPGTELVYEIRIKNSEYPQIAEFVSGFATNSEGGGYHAEIEVFNAGRYAYGQHGNCDRTTGEASHSYHDAGHLVPPGWTYIQMRITWIELMNASGSQYTPKGFIGIRMNPNAIDC